MKVLYIVHGTGMGGATISFFNMILGLKIKNIIPIVVYPSKGNNKANFEQILLENNIQGYQIPMRIEAIGAPDNVRKFLQYLAVFIYSRISRYKLSRIVEIENPDIIHTNTGVIHFGNEVALKYHIPHVWHIREYQDLDFHLKILPSNKRFCKLLQTSYVITITENLLVHFYLQEYPLAKCIYNGIYKKSSAIYDLPKEKFFLSASRISPEKGISDILEAFGRIHDEIPDYKLIIAGYGNQKHIEELRQLVSEKKIIKQVEFVGFIKDIKPLMRKATALIVASHNEGFGRMTAEASFMGCAVVGRNTAGTKEIMDKVGGLRFSSVNELARQMLYITRLDNDKYDALTRSAQEKAVDLFSVERNIDEVYNFYQSIEKRKS